MKKQIAIILFLISLSGIAVGQVSPVPVYRVPNATTPVGVNIPTGAIIIDLSTGDEYTVGSPLPSTATLTAPTPGSVSKQNHKQLTLDDGGTKGWGTNGLQLDVTNQVLGLEAASTTKTGALTSTDWNTFNSKLTSSLANGKIWVGNGSGAATAVTPSGDATISNAGAVTVSKATSNFYVGGKVTVHGSATDATPDSVLTIVAGEVKIAHKDVLKSQMGVTTHLVDDFEQSVDSTTVNQTSFYNSVILSQIPVASTIQVQVNGMNLKPTTQYVVYNSIKKIRLKIPVYKYDQISVSYSY